MRDLSNLTADELEELIQRAAELRKQEHLRTWARMAQADIDRYNRRLDWDRRDAARESLPRWRRIWERVVDPMPS